LHALDLGDDLLVDDVASFEARAIELARDPARLTRVRARLAQARNTTSLFDTPAYCKALEQAYEAMLAG
jgi:predicted O-linked N-acetylglucosamine transferase (SPINDLY family)